MKGSGMFTEMKCGCVYMAQPLRHRTHANGTSIAADEMNYIIVRHCSDDCEHREDRTHLDVRSLSAKEMWDSKPVEETFERELIGELCLMSADAFRFRRLRRILKEAVE